MMVLPVHKILYHEKLGKTKCSLNSEFSQTVLQLNELCQQTSVLYIFTTHKPKCVILEIDITCIILLYATSVYNFKEI